MFLPDKVHIQITCSKLSQTILIYLLLMWLLQPHWCLAYFRACRSSCIVLLCQVISFALRRGIISFHFAVSIFLKGTLFFPLFEWITNNTKSLTITTQISFVAFLEAYLFFKLKASMTLKYGAWGWTQKAKNWLTAPTSFSSSSEKKKSPSSWGRGYRNKDRGICQCLSLCRHRSSPWQPCSPAAPAGSVFMLSQE